MTTILSLGPPRRERIISEEFEDQFKKLQRWVYPKCLAEIPLIRDMERGPLAYKFNMVFYDRRFDLHVSREGGIYCRGCDNSSGISWFCQHKVWLLDKVIRYYSDTQTPHEYDDTDPHLRYFIQPNFEISLQHFLLPSVYQLIHNDEQNFESHIRRQVMSQQIYITMDPTTTNLNSNHKDIWDDVLQRTCHRDYREEISVRRLLLLELTKLQQQAMSLELLYNFDEETSHDEWAVKQLRAQDEQLVKCIRFASKNGYLTPKFQSMAADVVRLTISTIRHHRREATIWTKITDDCLTNGLRTYLYLMKSVGELQIRPVQQYAYPGVPRLMHALNDTVERMPNGIREGYRSRLLEIVDEIA